MYKEGKGMYSEVIKNKSLKIKLEDMENEIYLTPIKTHQGIMLKLDGVLAKDMEIQVCDDGTMDESPNGMCFFKLKTSDENFKKLYFVYESGFYLDWEISECRGIAETKSSDDFSKVYVELFEKYTLECIN